MQRSLLKESFAGLTVFFTVAQERSFTKAAAQLGLSQTAVSHAVRTLEKRLGVQLLARNSRKVVPTEAGERLLQTVAPEFSAIDDELAALADLSDRPAGNVRITASDHSVRTILMPRLKKILPLSPEISVEVVADNGLVDIAADKFDAGIRLGESVAQDMIAVRIGPDARFALVATQRHLGDRSRPQVPADLMQHNCINVLMPTRGGVWAWEFEKDGQEVSVRVEGQLTFNSIFDCLDAAIAGLGIAYVPEELAAPYLRSGHLLRLLDDWCPIWPGLHLYYPSRRQPSGAMSVLIAALRYDGENVRDA